MGYPWGRAPLADGTGTTPTDIQRIIGAQFMTSGILPNGGLIVTGTAAMAYAVTAGAAMMWTSAAAKLGILVPVEATTVATDPAPATGSRVDTIYVDGQGAVRVAIGSTTVPSGVAIARFTVPAGITATTSASQRLDRDYAIATGASLGRLSQWVDPGGGPAGTSEVTRHQSQFFLPSDRILRVDLSLTVRSATATEGSMQVGLELSNGGTSWLRWVNVRHLPGSWDTHSAVLSTLMPAGTCTFKVRTRVASGGTYEIAAGSTTSSEASVWDAGVTR